jgi:hypothetical protein
MGVGDAQRPFVGGVEGHRTYHHGIGAGRLGFVRTAEPGGINYWLAFNV